MITLGVELCVDKDVIEAMTTCDAIDWSCKGLVSGMVQAPRIYYIKTTEPLEACRTGCVLIGTWRRRVQDWVDSEVEITQDNVNGLGWKVAG